MADEKDTGDCTASEGGEHQGASINPEAVTEGNPFLVMDFWEFAIISTLMVAFFPWSLLFCLFVYGMAVTRLLVIALLHDLVKTTLAVLSVLIPVILLVVSLFLGLAL